MTKGKSRRSLGKILIIEQRYKAWAMGEQSPELSPSDSILSTVRQFAAKHPEFPAGGIRWAIFNADSNGLAESGAIVRVRSSAGRPAVA